MSEVINLTGVVSDNHIVLNGNRVQTQVIATGIVAATGPRGLPGRDGIGSGGGGSGSWGAITGTIADQTDLQSALNTKLTKTSNLSDVSSPASARTNLGVAIGSDVQANIDPTTSADYYRGDKTFSNFNNAVRSNRLDQMAFPSSPVNMTAQKIINLGTPTANQDAATKSYVDSVAQGLNVKLSVIAATAAALPSNTYLSGVITASGNGALTVDGVTVNTSDRVLVKNEATAANNGIYDVTATGDVSHPFILTRSSDMDASSEIAGAFVFVLSGTVSGNTGYIVASRGPFTIGTTAITWTQFSSPGLVNSVNGKTGTVVLTKTDIGLGSVTNDAQLKASNLDTDGTLTANSDTKIASQKAVKTYVDAHNSDTINVKTYGAIGDGSHDDTSAIQSAIAAALATPNGTATVYFPAGTYKITAPLNATSATGVTNGFGVILRGAGHNASKIFKASSFGCAVTYNGSGGPADSPTQFGGMIDITVDGNATTGGLLQTNSAQQMFFRGCSFIGSNDVAWDFNTMQDSYFSQCTFNNCGSTTKPVINIYGGADGTSNMLWFEQIRVETFLNGAVWIKRGAGATGGGNNGFFWSQCKFENYPTIHGDIFVADGYTQQLMMDQIFISFGLFDSGYTTPANGIVFGDGATGSGLNQASFTNIFMNTGPTSLIGESVINIKGASGMDGPVQIDNVASTATMNTAQIVVNGASTLSLDIKNVSGPGTLIAGDGTTDLGTAGTVLTSNGTAALPTWQSSSPGNSGLVVATNLASGSATGTVTAPTTASISPTANALVLLAVSIRNGASTNPTAPTVTGNGLTWVAVNHIVFDTTSTSRRAIYVFRAMGASPTTGAITITMGESETDATWSVDSFTGVDTSGTNGSGAVVQSAATKDELGNSSLSVSLAAFTSILNGTYGAFGTDGNSTGAAGTGFIALGSGTNGSITTNTEFKSGNKSPVVENWTGFTGLLGGVAVEIKAAISSSSGGGDASTNTSTSVDGEGAVFSGTGGKTLKRLTATGILKGTSGVISAATAGTDYYNPSGTDVAVADGGTGSSTASGARTNLGVAASGANSDITGLSGLTTPLSVTQGGSGAATLTGILKGNGTGAFTVAASGTDYAPATSGSGVLKGNGSGGFSTATADTDYTTPTGTETLTNKRVTPRPGGTTSSATPTINTDNVDYYELTAQAVDITSFTTNLSGTPTNAQTLWISITGTASRAITWGTGFEASTVALPTTTSGTNRLDVGFVRNTVTSKWRCIAAS